MELSGESDIEGKAAMGSGERAGKRTVSKERERVSQSVLWRTRVELRAFGAKHVQETLC